MKVLTFSRQFPKGHPKVGQPTLFIEKILLNLLANEEISHSKCSELARQSGFKEDHPMYYIDTLRRYNCSPLKHQTIRAGSRFNSGDMASLRVWSDKPYRSKQIEFAQVEVKKTWGITISDGNFSIDTVQVGSFMPNNSELIALANNDGLSGDDFWSWFNIHPKATNVSAFKGQIICWSGEIDYGKPELITEKMEP